MMDDAPGTAVSHEFMRFARTLHLIKARLGGTLPAGLDPAAGQLLSWLVRQGPSRQADLADNTFLDPSTISRRVTQLVQQGLAERRPDPGDGRAVQLVPTERGRATVDAMAARRQQLFDIVLADWPDEDMAELARLLHRLNDDFEGARHRFDQLQRSEESHVNR